MKTAATWLMKHAKPIAWVTLLYGVTVLATFVPAFAGARDVILLPVYLIWLVLLLILLAILISPLVALYLLPTIVAWRRGHHNTAAIFVLNIALGWTFIGWIAAMVWASTVVRPPNATPLDTSI